MQSEEPVPGTANAFALKYDCGRRSYGLAPTWSGLLVKPELGFAIVGVSAKPLCAIAIPETDQTTDRTLQNPVCPWL